MQGSFAIRHLSYSLSTQVMILSAWQQYVSAVCQLSCNTAAQLAMCQLSCTLLAQVKPVNSAAVSAATFAEIAAELHPVVSDDTCHLSCDVLAEL